jgi:hypothetical protein
LKPALVAQWIEQEPSNLLVAGSIPAEGACRKVYMAMSSTQLEALVRRFLNAYAAKDIKAIRTMFSEDIVLRDWNLEVIGRDKAISKFEENFRESQSIEIKVNAIYLSERGASAEVEILVNQTEKLRVVDAFWFDKNQKIVSLVSYKGL